MVYFIYIIFISHNGMRVIYIYIYTGPSRGGGYLGLLPRGPGQKGARTQTVTNLQVLQDMK